MSPVVANRRRLSTAKSLASVATSSWWRSSLAKGLGGAFSALGLPEPVLSAPLRHVVGIERAGHLGEPALELGDRRARSRLQRVAALDSRPEVVPGLGEPRRRFVVLGLRGVLVLRRPAARIRGALPSRDCRPERGERLSEAAERHFDLRQLIAARGQAEIGGVRDQRAIGLLLGGVRLLLAGAGVVEARRERDELSLGSGQRSVRGPDSGVRRQRCQLAFELGVAAGEFGELPLDSGELGSGGGGAIPQLGEACVPGRFARGVADERGSLFVPRAAQHAVTKPAAAGDPYGLVALAEPDADEQPVHIGLRDAGDVADRRHQRIRQPRARARPGSCGEQHVLGVGIDQLAGRRDPAVQHPRGLERRFDPGTIIGRDVVSEVDELP